MPMFCPHCENEIAYLSTRRDVSPCGIARLEIHNGRVRAASIEFRETDPTGSGPYTCSCPECGTDLPPPQVDVRMRVRGAQTEETPPGPVPPPSVPQGYDRPAEEEEAETRTTADESVLERRNDLARRMADEAIAKVVRCPGCREPVDSKEFKCHKGAPSPQNLKYLCTCGTTSNLTSALPITEGK